MPPFKLATLSREPEFHLDRLLELLATVPDGFTTRRDKVWIGGQQEDGWDVTAGGYFIGVQPEYRCGFSEEGDGKVLTALLERVRETEGKVMLQTVSDVRHTPAVGEYKVTSWMASVMLGARTDNFEDNPRAGFTSMGKSEAPGTAVLVAYLKAWGVAE